MGGGKVFAQPAVRIERGRLIDPGDDGRIVLVADERREPAITGHRREVQQHQYEQRSQTHRACCPATHIAFQRKASAPIERCGYHCHDEELRGAEKVIGERMPTNERRGIFISYSHKDRKFLNEMKTMLAPAIRDGVVDLWDDTRITTGAKWRDEITGALQSARIGVLLVSDNFLESEFIAKHELPPLLDAARKEGLTVFWIYVSPCLYQHTEIAAYQAAHDLSTPLDALTKSKRKPILRDICTKLIQIARGEDSGLPHSPALLASKIAVSRLPASELLIGRPSELAILDAAWSGDSKKNVVIIVAFGGVGKSTLAAHWAATKLNDVDRYFDWSFYRQGSSDVFLKTALEFFGDATMAASAADGWTKGERLAQLVAQHRTLLILDGLEPLQDAKTGELRDPALQSLLRGLAQRNRGLCVVTTRQEIPDLDTFRNTTAPQWKLERLSKEAGASLLESLGVRGTATERETLASDVKGHALTLTLLGKFLAEAHEGDIRKRDLVSLHEADYEETCGHAFRVMEVYEEWLARDGRKVELAILRLLGLFDRPATPDCLGALRQAPSIEGLTDSVVTLTDTQWNLAVKRLVQLGFLEEQPWEPPRITGYSEEDARRVKAERIPLGRAQPRANADKRWVGGNALDAHPLIREHFARQLRKNAPAGWRAANGRLYEHLRDSVPYWPEGAEDLQPLYQAVVHGCQAGRFTETWDQVYGDRILRGDSGPYAFYSRIVLGLTGADLAAVRSFFTIPWKQPSEDFTPKIQSWLLNDAAFSLRAVGRLEEAREPMRAGLEADIALQEWKNGAISAANLSEIDLTLGDVASAVQRAEQSVHYANRSGDPFEIVCDRSNNANALHQAGRTEEAGEIFRAAETLQGKNYPDAPLLYWFRGFQYCDLLLAKIERAAWRRCLGFNEQLFDAQTLSSVEYRATIALPISARNRLVLGIALDKLTLGRVALFRAILGKAPIDRVHARVEAAVHGFREAGQADHLPRALLTRAWLRALQGDPTAARADLDEAQQLAERGPMRLFLADVHLYRARLFFRDNLNEAREELKKARDLIERCGYHRRDEELRDAEAVIGTVQAI
jgi:tetratricopeptide (TPR) repeat protein